MSIEESLFTRDIASNNNTYINPFDRNTLISLNSYIPNNEIDKKWEKLGDKFLDILSKFHNGLNSIIVSNFNSKHKMYNISDKKLWKLMQELQCVLDGMICNYYPYYVDKLNTNPKIRLIKVFYNGDKIPESKKFIKIYDNKKKKNKLEIKEEKEFVNEFLIELQDFIDYFENNYYEDFKIVYKYPEHGINKIIDGINDTIRKIKRYI